MNKNSILGFVIIGVILIAFSWYNSKIMGDQTQLQNIADSANVSSQTQTDALSDTIVLSDTATGISPVNASPYKDSMLIKASTNEETFATLQNDKINVDFSSLGAQPYKATIKGFTTHDKQDLVLLRERSGNLSISVFAGQEIHTDKFSFDLTERDDTSLTYRLHLDSSAFIQYKYTLPEDSYMISLDVKFVGMKSLIARNVTSLDLFWRMDIPRLEKGYDNEKNYSTIVYKFPNVNGVEDLGLRKDESEEDIRTKVEWVAFQQQFFSAILVAENSFSNARMNYLFVPEGDPDNTLMRCESHMQIPYSEGDEVSVPLSLYFGPNHFKTLKSYDKGFEKIFTLSVWLTGWINRYIIITVFDFLGRFIGNYGLIIFILTLLIKLVISPLTFKSYISSAKMRVLKPEIDKISAKYPKSEDAMKKQQETMALYSKTGVSMFGGCLPMLLQFPILFAMFRFFPASFELRQEGFLWA